MTHGSVTVAARVARYRLASASSMTACSWPLSKCVTKNTSCAVLPLRAMAFQPDGRGLWRPPTATVPSALPSLQREAAVAGVLSVARVSVLTPRLSQLLERVLLLLVLPWLLVLP